MDEGKMATEDTTKAEDRLLKAVEVQRELGVSRATAYRMMTDGTLPAYRFGGRHGRRPMVRVSLNELRAWLDAHRAAPSSAA
jgi:excisionase family DNA binding protein